jgi:hypothetical protein
MKYKLDDFSPSDYYGIKIDQVRLYERLNADKCLELLDDDNELEVYDIICRYGLDVIKNETWFSVSDGDIFRLNISSHDVLSYLFYSPDQFEGLSTIVYDRFVGIFASVAGGQGGGFALIDIADGHWIFKTKESSVQHVIWVPVHEVFVCMHDVSTYAWNNISLLLIKVTGEMAWVNLYSHDHFNDSSKYDPSILAILKKSSVEYFLDEDKPVITYRPEEDSLHFYFNNHWVCDCKLLLKIIKFESS